MAGKSAVSNYVKELFAKHNKNMGQRMTREEVLPVMMQDFHLKESEASDMFDVFNGNKDGKFSMREFQHFYDKVGHRGRAMMDLFDQLEDPTNQGTLDIGKTYDVLETLKQLHDGKTKTKSQLASMLEMYAGQEKVLDRKKFINIMGFFELPDPASGCQQQQ